MRTNIVNASTAQPLDLEEVKDHLRLEAGYTVEDDYLLRLIKTARQKAEDITNRRLLRQTINYYLDNWPADYCFELPYPPFSTETAPTIVYKDVDSSSITLSSTVYKCDSVSEPGRICLDYNENWPTVILHNVNPIRVQYLCGYDGSTAVPEEIKQAMLLTISDLYEFRESYVAGVSVNELPRHALSLLQSYRIRNF